MTNTNTQPLSEEWNEVITNICDDLICNTGLEPDGEKLGITTTRELVEELEVILKERLPHLLSEAKREAVEECIKALPKHLNTTDHRTGDDIEQNIWFNGCVDDANVALQSLLDQPLKAKNELSSNQSK